MIQEQEGQDLKIDAPKNPEPQARLPMDHSEILGQYKELGWSLVSGDMSWDAEAKDGREPSGSPSIQLLGGIIPCAETGHQGTPYEQDQSAESRRLMLTHPKPEHNVKLIKMC
jgi:hypothetical protein